MEINCKSLTRALLQKLEKRVEKRLKKTPCLAIVQVGADPASTSYIRTKKKAACRVGIAVKHEKFPVQTSSKIIEKIIEKYNKNPRVQAVIVQLPLPQNLNADRLISHIKPLKEVDGFQAHSPYTPPVVCAVLKILQAIKSLKDKKNPENILILGRGKTGGGPIIKTLKKKGFSFNVIHSQTKNPDRIIKKADIVISCVGKAKIIHKKNIKKGAVLISVGIYKGEEGLLHGDYEEEEIKEKASLYTPTPGSIGPLTVACLLKNVVSAAEKQT